jgi:predicted CopG family antitoxin
MKQAKNITLHADEIVIGNKLSNLKNRSFSEVVGELLVKEYQRVDKKKKN